ncbi:hypothetical protein [Arthrobacter sp. TE12232]
MSAPVVSDDVLHSHALAQTTKWSSAVTRLLVDAEAPVSTPIAVDALHRLLPDDIARVLLPLSVVDEASLACTVLEPLQVGDRALRPGHVVRVFLTEVHPRHQLAVLDIDPLAYVSSLEAELTARSVGLARVLDEIGPAYKAAYIDRDKHPRDFVARPVRLACQNVIVALAAIAGDSAIDGLAAVAWQTAEVPHVATHEANRALLTLTLCDTFAHGGTMEVRFDRQVSIALNGKSITYRGHPEGRIPASLARYARTVGAYVDPAAPALTPTDARALFWAVTSMPDSLRTRLSGAVATTTLTPERACYTMASAIWHPVELDMLLATSEHTPSILTGGVSWTDRSARQAESDAARAALLGGMFHRRLDGTDHAGSSTGPRVVEDSRTCVTWDIDDGTAIITFHLPGVTALPWTTDAPLITDTVHVAPRVHVTDTDLATVRTHLQAGRAAALLLPADVPAPPGTTVPVLRCPDRLSDLDRLLEATLTRSRTARA